MYLFQRINKSAAAAGVDKKSTEEARQWYRDAAQQVGKVDRNKVMNTAGAFKLFPEIGNPSIGKLYMYFYDAKHKDTLPFFDQFPLVFPIWFYPDGFLGINLHYLPPGARASLMDALYTITNNESMNKNTKLTISYSILKRYAEKFAGFQNCIKRYLFSHVKSSFHYVNPADWDKALMLPLQKWYINPNARYRGTPPY